MSLPYKEFTSYPVNGPSPQRCNAGHDHYLHILSRWAYGERLGYNWHGKLVPMPDPQRAEIGFASVREPMIPRVPVHKFVRIPVGRNGKPDLSTILIEQPAVVTAQDVKLLAEGTEELDIAWSLERNDDGSANVDVEPQSIIVNEPHGPDEVLSYYVHSSGLILAGLRLIASESIIRNHVAELQ